MKKKLTAWKKYVAIMLTAFMLLGTWNTVFAEETEETESAEELQTEEETEAVIEEETEEDEENDQEKGTEDDTGEMIAEVESSSGSIVTTDVSQIVENCMPSIVAITNISVEEVESYYYGTMEYEAESTASGIIIDQNDEELLIATNDHVVSNAKELTVCFSVDAEDPEDLVVPAKLKGSDSVYELAVIAVQKEDIPDGVLEQLRTAKLGSSGDLKVGQAAIAIGNALGYGQSVTVGVISALDRPLTIDNFSMDVILTDAAINFGNSGSALLNEEGELIGICVAKENNTYAEGMGYAIPIDTAIPVLEVMASKDTRDKLSDAARGYIGATVLEVSEEASEIYGMPGGAFVYDVAEDSPAEAAGIKKGDIITKIQGETVTGSSDLIEKMSYYAPGETITLEVQTANNGTYEARDVDVTLEEGDVTEEEETEEPDADEPEEGDPEADGSDEDEWMNPFYGFEDDFDWYNDEFSDGFEDYNDQFSMNF